MAHTGPATYLDVACRSIDAQAYRDFELIIVDDGAGIDWDSVLRGVRFRWRLLNHPIRSGLARAMNRAARAAVGELLARMDSDDVIAPSRLERQVADLDARPDIAFLGSAVCWLDDRGRHLGRSYPLTDPGDLSLGLSTYNQMCHGSMLIRREAFEGLGGYDESFGVAQDYEFWLRALRAGHSFANLPQPLYGHRLHGSSISRRAAMAQSDAAGQLWKRESSAERSARVLAWFGAGRDGWLGRPYEALQLGRLALLLGAAAVSKRIGPSSRRSVAVFSAQHGRDALELLLREVSWRHGMTNKLRRVLSGR